MVGYATISCLPMDGRGVKGVPETWYSTLLDVNNFVNVYVKHSHLGNNFLNFEVHRLPMWKAPQQSFFQSVLGGHSAVH